MGGRGSFAAGHNVPYSYRTVGYINGVKVLEGTGNQHGLPEEAHSSFAYIKLNLDGSFREMRFYDNEHYLTKEVACHPERSLDPPRKPIVHIHEYKRDNFHDRDPRLLTEHEYNLYKKFFKGELRWKPEM